MGLDHFVAGRRSTFYILTCFSTQNVGKDIINIRPTSKGALCQLSHSNQPVYQPSCGPTQPDTRCDNRPQTPFLIDMRHGRLSDRMCDIGSISRGVGRNFSRGVVLNASFQ